MRNFNLKFTCTLTVMLCVLTMFGHSQSRKVNGTVISPEDEPLIGVSVVIPGTTIGVITNAKGGFTIDVPKGKNELKISCLGYKPQIMQLGSKTNITITLQEDAIALDEVVAIGYGHARRSDVTGSVASISGAEIEGKAATSVDDLLRGRVAGVKVGAQDGAPGASTSIKIRGGTSINASSEPLYVIDGFPMMNSSSDFTVGSIGGVGSNTSPLADINPEDIKSIDILKDASATAIYGSRGANGVIIITTKQAKDEKSNISYTGYYAVSEQPDIYPMMNSENYRIAMNEKRRYLRGTTGNPTDPSGNNIVGQGNWDNYLDKLTGINGTDWNTVPNTNWQKEIYRLGQSTKHQVTISGGNAKTKYIAVADYYWLDGIVKNTDYSRASGRISVEHDVFKWMNFKSNNSYAWSEQNGITQASGGSAGGGESAGIFFRALRYYPDRSPQDGIYAGDEIGEGDSDMDLSNPYVLLKHALRRKMNQSFSTNNALTIKFLPNLVLKSSLNIRMVNVKQDQFYSKMTGMGLADDGRARIGAIYTQDILNENILTWNKTYNRVHKFDFMGGFTLERFNREEFVANAKGFPNEYLGIYDIGVGTRLAIPSSGVTEWSLMSFLSRFNYNYNDKYLLTASIRADGSSRFAPGNKWGYFPSAAVAWRVSQEDFLRNSRAISNLKVRASYGITGNQEISLYRSMQTYRSTEVAFNDTVERGYVINAIANKNLTWETTAQSDLGVDISFLSNRISLSADLYYKLTKDLLLSVPTMLSSGIRTQLMNLGQVENKGLELTMNTEILKSRPRSKKLGWTFDVNYTMNKNRVLSLGTTNEFFRSLNYADQQAKDQILVRTNNPLGTWFGYQVSGIIQYKDPYLDRISTILGSTPTAGDYKFVDQNGDNKIDEADRVNLGCSQPKFYGGFSTTLRYRDFDLSMTFEYSYGAKLFNATKALISDPNSQSNLPASMANRWVGPDWQNVDGQLIFGADGLPVAIPGTGNPSNTTPRIGSKITYQLQSNYIEDGSYLRLSNVKLRYAFPLSLCKKLGLGYCAAYFSANNLWLLTNYTGSDPDVNIDPQGYGNIMGGYDFDAYPRSRMYTLGLTINF